MKKIVIIGASSGIGRQVALDFARGGWRVGIAARREEPLKEIKSQYPDRVAYSVIDVTRDDAAVRFMDLVEMIDGMDVLLLSAGVGWLNPLLHADIDTKTVAVNCAGFARIMDAAYNYYKATASASPGHIAAITSIAGIKGIGVAASYSASKRFQWTYIDALEQLAHQEHVNVDFTDIRPGFIATPLLGEGNDFPMTMSLRYAAARIERAILRRRRVAVIDGRWRVVNALWRALPRVVWRNIALDVKHKE